MNLQSPLVPIPITYGSRPPKGPLALLDFLDFTAATGSNGAQITREYLIESMNEQMDFIQGVYVNNQGNTQNLNLKFGGTLQILFIPGGRLALLPFFSPANPLQVTATISAAATVVIQLVWVNMPVAPCVWGA